MSAHAVSPTHVARHVLRTALLAAALIATGTTAESATPLVAFPGAVGQGAAAIGGRGGDVYHVVNLDDYDPKTETKIPGSLRHAIRSAEGPRTIVFDVGGAIALHAPLPIRKDRLTIAGQTAPAPGITLWGYPVEIVGCRDVVVRYLRVRLGDFHIRGNERLLPSGRRGHGDLTADSANAVYVGGGCERVIVDHLSASWSTDETLSVTVARDVTIQRCLIASSLDNSLHSKGRHGYGSLIRGELTPEDQQRCVGGYTLFGNLWMHHRARNPSIGGQQSLRPGQAEADRRASDVNVVNNVIYNWGGEATHRNSLGPVRINLVGNYYVCGHDKQTPRIFREGYDDAPTELYYAGNYYDGDLDARHNGAEVHDPAAVQDAYVGFTAEDRLRGPADGEPFCFYGDLADDVQAAPAAYDAVVADVGASLDRDAIDDELIDQLRTRTGAGIDSQEELRGPDGVLSGLDDLPVGRRPEGFDDDGDGMADNYERRRGLDPSNPDDGAAVGASSDEYTNLEVYLDWLTRAPAQTETSGGSN